MFLFLFANDIPKNISDSSKDIMTLTESQRKILKNKFTVSMENASLEAILSEVTNQTKVEFSVITSSPIVFSAINVSNRTIESFLLDLLESYHLHISVKNNIVCVHACQETWKSYNLYFFGNEVNPDILPGLENFKSHTASSTIQNNSYWQEIEKTIQKVTPFFSLDKINGYMLCKGDCRVHAIISEYCKFIDTKYIINLKFSVIEILVSDEYSSLIPDLLENIIDLPSSIVTLNLSEVLSSIKNLCLKVNKLNNNINIALRVNNNLYLQTMPQQIAHLTTAKQMNFQSKKAEIIKDRLAQKAEYEYTVLEDGLSLSAISSIILGENNAATSMLIKLKACIQSVNPKNDSFEVERRQISTTLKLNQGQNIILGGLSCDKTLFKTKIVTRIPILSLLFNKRQELKVKSYFLLFIQPTFVKT